MPFSNVHKRSPTIVTVPSLNTRSSSHFYTVTHSVKRQTISFKRSYSLRGLCDIEGEKRRIIWLILWLTTPFQLKVVLYQNRNLGKN